MIRTPKFALRFDPENSRAIGYHATQQNAACTFDDTSRQHGGSLRWHDATVADQR